MATFHRQSAGQKALRMASMVRARAGLSQQEPICVFDLCDAVGVTVRFNDINMEGMYQKGEIPRIHLSSKRPLSRRVFNCGHELGHHEFGHGNRIDELSKGEELPSWDDEDEFLANTFSGHLLMPILGLRYAFNLRKWNPETTTPEQLYVIACDFGVGYRTLVTHLYMGTKMISASRYVELKKSSPKKIRARLLGEEVSSPLVVAGEGRVNPRIDVEVGTLLLLPRATKVDVARVEPIREVKNAMLYRAVKPGLGQVKNTNWSAFMRVSRKDYIGLARYRHLEDDE